MRLLLAAALAALLVGCEYTSSSSSKTTATNPDGSSTTTETSTKTVNGKSTGTKTETTLTKDGKLVAKKYEMKDGNWVPVSE